MISEHHIGTEQLASGDGHSSSYCKLLFESTLDSNVVGSLSAQLSPSVNDRGCSCWVWARPPWICSLVHARGLIGISALIIFNGNTIAD